MTSFFALTTRGLEDIVANELRDRVPTAQISEVAYRRVLFDASPEAAPALLGLRCADDLFVLVATWHAIGRPRINLDRIADLSARVDMEAALELCAALRSIERPVQFAVSASFVGKRNYTSPEMKLSVAAGVEQNNGWHYRDDEAPEALSLRLFIEHDLALLGVRLAAQPLHRRSDRAGTVPGSLKPPVAAALVQLAGVGPGTILLDPLCGAGTILLEAAFHGAIAYGGDNDPVALAVASANVAAAARTIDLQTWDARHLPLADASVDAVATNLPFGRQVLPDTELELFYAAIVSEIARVLRPGGHAVLLTSSPNVLASQPAFQVVAQREISLHGQNPTIVVGRIL